MNKRHRPRVHRRDHHRRVTVRRGAMAQNLLPAVLEVPAEQLRGWYHQSPTPTSPGWIQLVSPMPRRDPSSVRYGVSRRLAGRRISSSSPRARTRVFRGHQTLVNLQAGYPLDDITVTRTTRTALRPRPMPAPTRQARPPPPARPANPSPATPPRRAGRPVRRRGQARPQARKLAGGRHPGHHPGAERRGRRQQPGLRPERHRHRRLRPL